MANNFDEIIDRRNFRMRQVGQGAGQFGVSPIASLPMLAPRLALAEKPGWV